MEELIKAARNLCSAASKMNDTWISGAKVNGKRFEDSINELATMNVRLQIILEQFETDELKKPQLLPLQAHPINDNEKDIT